MKEKNTFFYISMSSNLFINLSRICRLCLLNEGSASIFNENMSIKDSRIPLVNKIMNCVSIEMFEGDGLPTLICQHCTSQVDKFYEFKELCESSDSTLHRYLTKLQPGSGSIQELNIKQECAVGNGTHTIRYAASPNREARNSVTEQVDIEQTSQHGGVMEHPPQLALDKAKSLVTCTICCKSFGSVGRLKEHEVIHSQGRSHICQYCGIGFLEADDLSHHISNDCKHIDSKNISSDLVLDVSGSKFNKSTSFICQICSKSFSKRVYLKRHEIIHSGKKPYICKECGNAFSRTGDLAKHLRIHARGKCSQKKSLDTPPLSKMDMDNVDQEYVCKACSRSFTKEYYLKQHLVVHKEASTYLCEECGKSFYRRGALTQHKVTHTGIKSHSCNVCNKAFTFLGRLKEHERLHAGVKPFLCNICGKSFGSKEGLLAHERTHTGEKPFACLLCDRRFATTSNLRTHTRHHTEGKRFPCPACGSAFFTKSGLERHERLHTGLKPFTCSACGLAFYTKREMIRHNSYHLGNKRFACDKCSKSYFERQHLVIHKRTHTGERPYACNWCKKSFFESSKLKRHMQTHIKL